jgi:hypothetical protein
MTNDWSPNCVKFSQFRWPDNTVIRAQVTAFSRVDSSVYPTAVQDMNIEILTPFGASLKASSQVRIIIYHGQFQERQAFMDDFRMIGM